MPIRETFNIEKKEGQTFEPLPKGVYQLELIDIELVEKDKYQKPGEKENVFEFTYGVVNDGDFRARRHWENFIPTYLYIGKNGKNKLYQIIEAHVKDILSPEQEAKMDTQFINNLIGGQVQVAIGTKTKGDKTYQVVESWLPANTSMTSLTVEEKEVKKKETEEQSPVPTDEEINLENVNF